MEIELFRKDQLTKTLWSGGTTTQLYIYPRGSNYQSRDFSFRISTATIDVEESEFSSLPGFHRKLMVLKGEIALSHNNAPAHSLRKFDVDTFEGNWNTLSKGKAIDFNLIYKDPIEGELEGRTLASGESCMLQLHASRNFMSIYFLSGNATLNTTFELIKFTEGGFAVLRGSPGDKLVLTAVNSVEVAITQLRLE